MSNALTSINEYAYDRDLSNINNLQKKIEGNREGKSFSELFKEKLNKDGSVDQNKLEGKDKKLYKACLDLESLLWKQVLNEMKKTTNKYKLLDGGQGEEIFTDFLYDEYASMMSKNANTRISDTLFKQLSGYR
ncbi:MAG TPA: rod-binding protein [Spirochaetota bacterium]|nr:rod-binding protein [Spirochaetota bacterium]